MHIKCFSSAFAKRYKNYPYSEVDLLNKTFLDVILIDAKFLSIFLSIFLFTVACLERSYVCLFVVVVD